MHILAITDNELKLVVSGLRALQREQTAEALLHRRRRADGAMLTPNPEPLLRSAQTAADLAQKFEQRRSLL